MLAEAVAALAPRPGHLLVDCTFGRGGHTRELLRHVGPEGRVLAIDRDPDAVAVARALALDEPRLLVAYGSFGDLLALARGAGLDDGVDGVLLDLGVSSAQLDTAARGFSFRLDGPLDMRMDPEHGESAAEWLARAEVGDIARVLFELGEERHARRIARAIVAARAEAPIVGTRRLAEIVAGAVPGGGGGQRIHPATRTFQAVRIHVNGELEALERALAQSLELLRPGGRLVVISFHSLEDRIVKRFLRAQSRGPLVPRGLPITTDAFQPRMVPLGRAQRPGAEEVARNPRARSAVLRAGERQPSPPGSA
ncbi:MAG: 16S rRNA (cytosine(1402)-N(4))-methyltransferase RsmH [Ectothiorhodospiraceae bacterium]|nr:16S rRNA (cytosine(1402)-N(4))-methyltransferase RsmH [Ectothiorhodospiraceae bacterium]